MSRFGTLWRVMTELRSVVRRVARALLLVPVLLVTSLAAPALAGEPSTWPEAPTVSGFDMLLVLVILPGAAFIFITLMVFVPSWARGQKYQPGQAWRGESTWFGGPQDGVEAADRADARTAQEQDADRGGASARW
jgi:hypothetical protein